MDKDIVIALIGNLPSTIGIIALVGFLYLYRQQINDLLSRIGSIKAFGVEAQFAEGLEQLNNAVRSYGLTSNETELKKVFERANRTKQILSTSRILWVDERPLTNANIYRFLNIYGIVIDLARDTEEALGALRWAYHAYDVVVTDMVRHDQYSAGLDLIRGLKQLEKERELEIKREQHENKPVLIFFARLDVEKGTPVGAEVITNNPVELIHRIIDCLERTN
jgi:CheY-like chemotaxis protein